MTSFVRIKKRYLNSSVLKYLKFVMSLNSSGSRFQSFTAEYCNVFCPMVDLAAGMFNNESSLNDLNRKLALEVK